LFLRCDLPRSVFVATGSILSAQHWSNYEAGMDRGKSHFPGIGGRIVGHMSVGIRARAGGAIAVIWYHYHAAHQLTPPQSWIWIRRGRALSSNGTVISSTPSCIFAVSFSVFAPSGRGTVV
jgi:hypothetical protein